MYKKVAENLKGIVKVGAIDCDEQANQPVCGQYGVRGFPTIKLFPGDKTGSKKLAVDYQGDRSAGALVNYAVGRLPDKHVVSLSADASAIQSSLEDFMEKEEQLAKVILFTNKKNTPAIFKALTLEFKDRLVFGEVRESESDYCEKYKVSQFPTILVQPVKGDPVKFDGVISYAGIAEFLGPYAGGASSSSSSSSSKKDEPKKEPRAPLDPNVPKVASLEDLNEHCAKHAEAAGLSALCVLTFLPPLEPEFKESVEQHESYIEVLKKLKASFYQLADTEKLPSFQFVWLDGTAKSGAQLINKFGMSSDLPSVMVLSPKKKVYGKYLGGFGEKDLTWFLKDAGRGVGRVFPYNWDIEFVAASKPAAVKDEL